MKHIQILGPGCAKCEQLKKNVDEAVSLAGVEATVEKISDINAIVSFGVMSTPALAIDGQVKSVGKLLSVDQVKELLG